MHARKGRVIELLELCFVLKKTKTNSMWPNFIEKE
jgi:hypothetical protein